MFSGSAKVVAFVPLDSRHPSRPAFGVDDWGAENDGGRGHHCPACPQRVIANPSGSKNPVILAAPKGGDDPSRRQDQSPSPRRRWGLGRGESSGSCK